jgi:hypothetical protein
MALKFERLYLVSFFFIPSPCFSLSLFLLPVGAACSNFFAFIVVVAAIVVVVVVGFFFFFGSVMEGSSRVCGWTSEEYDPSHRFYSIQAHAFQPFNPPFQQHGNNVGIFQPPSSLFIPVVLGSGSEMMTPLKRRHVEEE